MPRDYFRVSEELTGIEVACRCLWSPVWVGDLITPPHGGINSINHASLYFTTALCAFSFRTQLIRGSGQTCVSSFLVVDQQVSFHVVLVAINTKISKSFSSYLSTFLILKFGSRGYWRCSGVRFQAGMQMEDRRDASFSSERKRGGKWRRGLHPTQRERH